MTRADNEYTKLSQKLIKAFLRDNTECAVKVFDTIDSTNSEAKRVIKDGLNIDAIFVAEGQTGGRGRRGKSFFSPNTSGLYFTAVLHPNISLSDATGITAAAAVAVCDIIKNETKKDPKIKWVNDIFIDGKKVCGILTEAVTDFETNKVSAVIVGIGINLTTSDFPSELKNIAGAVGKDIDRNRLSAELFIRLKSLCDTLPEKSFMDSYRGYSMVLGNKIEFSQNGIFYQATAEKIHDDGSLEVQTLSNETFILNSGEISIKLS